jgi:glycosyltransferase involved in cell wall biosynthesis
MREYKPDIVVVDSEPFGLLALEVALIRRLFFPHARLIVHSSQNLYKRYPFPFSATEAFVMRQSTAIFARSEEIQQVLIRKKCTCPIHVVPHGVDTKRFSPIVDKEIFRYKNRECVHFGYVGALVWHKGVHVLLDAVSDLRVPFKLTIVGNGPELDVLQAQAASLSTSSNIQFNKSVPNAQLPDTLRNFDVLVLPSITVPNWKEQFGRIIIESMACGVPVVGSTCGSIPDVIGDGGLVFTERDAIQLRAILERLAKDSTLLENLTGKARQRAEKYFSWENVASRIYAIYNEMLQIRGES